MAAANAALGDGTTVVFGSEFSGTPSTSVYDVKSVTWDGMERSEAESTHMATTASPATFAGKTWLPGKKVTCGTVTIEGNLNPDITPPIEGAKGALTVAWAGGTSWAASAICTDFNFTDPLEELMAYTCVFEMTGGITQSIV